LRNLKKIGCVTRAGGCARNENPSESLGKKLKRLLNTASPLKQSRAVSQCITNSLFHTRLDDVKQNLVVRKTEDLLEHGCIHSPRRGRE
jgi:hypothetical protein